MSFARTLVLMVLGLMSTFSVRGGNPNSEVLCNTQHVSIIDGKLVTTDSVEMVIYNAYGNQEIEVDYDKMHKLKVFKAWIEDMNGKKVSELSKGAFVDRNQFLEFTMYADCRVRTCNTDYSMYPHRFVYTSTTVSDAFMYLADWLPRSSKSLPLRKAELWIHRPLTYAVRTKCVGVNEAHSDTVGKVVTTHYVMTPGGMEDATTSKSNILQTPAFVWVVPERFMYGLEGFHTSWNKFGNWVEQLNYGLTVLPDEERLKVKTILSETRDTLEQIRILYHYLQDHTRYVNVHLGIGGMKSYPASYVAINKFGDCKALSNYMKALLAEAGIRSHFVLVNRAVFTKRLYTDYPTSQFNHMMLLVPLGKDTLWLENTSSTNAMGYVDVTTQNRLALLVDGMNSRLIQTPSFEIDDVKGSRKLDIRFPSEKETDVSISHRGRGWENEQIRGVANEISSASQLKYLEQFIPFKHYDMKQFEFKPVSRDERYAQLDLSFRLTGFLLRTQTSAYLPQISMYKGMNSFVKPDGQTHCFPFPVCQDDTVLYHLPRNLQLKSMPDAVTLSCPYGSFASTFKSTEDGLMNVKSFRIQEGTYPPDAYHILYDFIQKITDVEKKSLPLQTDEKNSIALP